MVSLSHLQVVGKWERFEAKADIASHMSPALRSVVFYASGWPSAVEAKAAWYHDSRKLEQLE